MNICIVCNEFPPYKCGGIGILSKELADNLISKGHTVFVIGIYPDTEEKTTCANGLRVIRLKSWKGALSALTDRVRLGYRIKELIKLEKIELVEVPDFEGSAAFWPKLGIPIITRLNGSVTYFSHVLHERVSGAMFFMERRSLLRSDYICSASQYTGEMTKDIFDLKSPIRTIYNGITIPSIDKCKSSYDYKGIVSFSGSIMRKKGALSLAHAWIEVKKSFPDARLRLIGKDTLEGGKSVLEMLLKIVGSDIHDSIEFYGHVSKQSMEELLAQSDLAVYPSYAEAFSLAPLEAMALKLPVIYSNRTSGLELAKVAQSIKIVDPDNIRELSNAICSFLSDRRLREASGENNRGDVTRHFSINKTIGENLSFYRQCIDSGLHSRRIGVVR